MFKVDYLFFVLEEQSQKKETYTDNDGQNMSRSKIMGDENLLLRTKCSVGTLHFF